MFCKVVVDHNIKYMANWYFVNKHYSKLPPEIYLHIMNLIMEPPKLKYVKHKRRCIPYSDENSKCTKCNVLLCKSHSDIDKCITCDLILCRNCVFDHYFHQTIPIAICYDN